MSSEDKQSGSHDPLLESGLVNNDAVYIFVEEKEERDRGVSVGDIGHDSHDKGGGVTPPLQRNFSAPPGRVDSDDEAAYELISEQQEGLNQLSHSALKGKPIDYMERLCLKFMPILHFHSEEQFFPCSVEYYLNHCRLRCGPKKGKEEEMTTLVNAGDLNQQVLVREARLAKDKHPGTKVHLNLGKDGKDYRVGMKGNLEDVPLYCRVRDIEFNGAQMLEIVYIVHYAYNGSYNIMGCIPLGAHDADFEHITVRVLPASETIHSIYFAAHASRDGMWWTPKDQVVELEDGLRPHVYVAHNGHGHYPWSSSVFRICCCANDRLDDKGETWVPSKIELIGIGSTNFEKKFPWLAVSFLFLYLVVYHLSCELYPLYCGPFS